MKSYVKYINGAVIILLAFFCARLYSSRKEYKELYGIAEGNNKAYQEQVEGLAADNRTFQFTISQLEQLNDNTVRSLDSMRRELKIKDNKILQMGKTKEYVFIHDTVTSVDTFYKDPGFVLDTCISDKWHSTCLHMAYPNIIGVCTEVNLEQDCFLYKKRETINPPCETWIGRLFQRKHDVYQVIIKEHNPYSSVTESKFIKILDNE